MDREVTVALIGAVGVAGTVLGTFAGTVLGARIQARGGHAQAQAARDAALTAAEAARRQVLHEREWAALSTFLRAASESFDQSLQTYTSAPSSATEDDRVHSELMHAHAQAELAAPRGLGQLIVNLFNATVDMHHAARTHTQRYRGAQILAGIGPSDPGGTEAELARRALAELASARSRASGVTDWDSQEQLDARTAYVEAQRALSAVVQLDPVQYWALLAAPDSAEGPAGRELTRLRQSYFSARTALITAARDALGMNGA
ncbi:hypothetical protein [Streptomyces sp. NPDC045251]|uniref:hypothetical protein n=1 Tax=unclassified Streptomyces TaxID=2593676 RepID=UPI00340D10EF